MARLMSGRPKKRERSVSLRLPASFVAKVRRLALDAGQDVGDWLAQAVGREVDEMHARLVRRLAAQEGKEA